MSVYLDTHVAVWLGAGFVERLSADAKRHIPFATVSFAALAIDWSPDPLDRLIVAQAASRRLARLVTADTNIRQHYAQAVW